MKYFFFIFPVFFVNLPVFAQDTRLGDFGFVLGTSFDKSRSAGIVSQESGLITYKIKIPDMGNEFQQIQVAVTAKNIIYNIIATARAVTMGECEASQRRMLKVLQTRYPNLEYYANGDADMIYDKQATAVVSCENKGGKVVFKLEYLHDEIYQGLSDNRKTL